MSALRRAFGVAVVLLAVATPNGAHEAPTPASPGARFEAPAAGSYELPPIRTLDRHTLLDERGEARALLDARPGRVTLVAFIYLDCPHACPRTHAVFQKLDREAQADAGLRGRLDLLTVSFDPKRDTPARMAELRENLRPQGPWRFRTAANTESLAPVLADFGQDALGLVTPEGGDTGLIRHLLKVFLVDAEHRVRNVYSSEFLRGDLLLNDVRTVLGIAPG